jgi:hypothetical protein
MVGATGRWRQADPLDHACGGTFPWLAPAGAAAYDSSAGIGQRPKRQAPENQGKPFTYDNGTVPGHL